jgi:hypothetical protein
MVTKSGSYHQGVVQDLVATLMLGMMLVLLALSMMLALLELPSPVALLTMLGLFQCLAALEGTVDTGQNAVEHNGVRVAHSGAVLAGNVA